MNNYTFPCDSFAAKIFGCTARTNNGVLPDLAGLQALIEKLNITPQHHVVVYDDEGGAWAGRLIWNLHCLGFERTSLINGGIHAWLGAALPTTADVEKSYQSLIFYTLI